MSNPAELSPDIEERARALADDIKGRRNSLADEDAKADPASRRYQPTYARAKEYRDEDRIRINGMVIALSHLLGRPLDMHLAEEFIADTPTWRALL